MTMTLSALEKHLFNKALDSIRAQLTRACEELRNIHPVGCGRFGWMTIELQQGDKKINLSIQSILEEATFQYLHKSESAIADHAAKEFMEKVENLQDQLDEIRSELPNQDEG